MVVNCQKLEATTMGLFDPIEYKAARDYLSQGQLKEAARSLLTGKNRDHRSVKRLLVEVGQRLIEQAQHEADEGLWEAAKETLALAGQCLVLDGRALALQQRIEQTLAEKRRQAELQAASLATANRKLDEVKRLVAMGEFGPAFQIVEQLRENGIEKAAEVAGEIRLVEERFSQAAQECRNAISARDEGLARLYWERVRSLCPQSPEVKLLAAELARIVAARDSSFGKPLPVRSRMQRFVIEDVGAIILAEEIAIGVPQEDNVQLPILGRIHRRHAVLIRDRQGWQLMACRDKYGRACRVQIDGAELDGVARLRDGNIVQLGESNCRWLFRLPVAGSLTALWEAHPGSSGMIFGPRGQSVKRAILLADEVTLGVKSPAHLVIPDWPCQRGCLRWHEGGLHWDVQGGSVWMEIPGLTWHSKDRQVYLPSRLTISAQWDEAERLGRMMVNQEAREQVVLSFCPWES